MLRSSLELLNYKEWFKNFAGEWVNTACTLLHNGVKKLLEEPYKVSSFEIVDTLFVLSYVCMIKINIKVFQIQC